MLVLVGDNRERTHSKAALAKICGFCPVPVSNGDTSRYRLNLNGNSQANAAFYRVVIVRMRVHQPTLDYVKRRTIEGEQTRDHSLPQAPRSPQDFWLSLSPSNAQSSAPAMH
jgi:hypothetical protein